MESEAQGIAPSEACQIESFQSMICVVGGVQVMLDCDLAALYGVPVKRLNEQVKRNKDRFPSDFMFQLSKEDCLRSQIATLNGKRGEHLKYMPYAFTENHIAMLSSVLRSPTAIEVNIRIMRAFVAMRRFLLSNAHHFQRIETLILDDKELYLIGVSLKDLGKKCFAIAKLVPSEIAGLKARL